MTDTPTPSPVQQQQLADLRRKQQELAEGFRQAESIGIPTIPEGIFVRDFLPLFSGKDLSQRDYLLGLWYQIAGTPYGAVNIIGAGGAVVMTVPPVLDRNAIGLAESKGNNLLSVFEEAKQRSAINPRLGDNIINAELQTRLDAMRLQDEPAPMSAQWTALLNHYDKAPGARKGAGASRAEESDFESDFE